MKTTILGGIFLIAMSLSAQQINTSKLDSLLTSVENNNKNMGSLSVFKNGEEIYSRSLGFADFENQIKTTESTRYRVGSITKMYTATVIMQLVEEGKLSLDTKLSAFYPRIPNAEDISITHLLKHQSGLFNFGRDKTFQEWKYSFQTKDQLLERFYNYPADFAPGEKSAYSNSNYILLGFIIEDITNQSFSDVLKKRILEPLSLKNTYYGGKINNSKNEANSYERLSDWEKENETDISITRGAGAIVSTPRELNIFLTALFNHSLVSKESLNKMLEFEKGFGLGMYPISFYKEENFIGHTGGIDGFSTMLAFSPATNLSIAYSSNGTNMNMDELMEGIFSIALGKNYKLPDFGSIKLTIAQLQPFTGTYGAENFPLKIKVLVENDVLMGQATGQPAFPMDAIAENKFKFDRAGLTMEFFPAENKMVFSQGGKAISLVRE